MSNTLIVVDCTESCAVQMETIFVAQPATSDLSVDKADRNTRELRGEPEDVYCRFRRTMQVSSWSLLTAFGVAHLRQTLF